MCAQVLKKYMYGGRSCWRRRERRIDKKKEAEDHQLKIVLLYENSHTRSHILCVFIWKNNTHMLYRKKTRVFYISMRREIKVERNIFSFLSDRERTKSLSGHDRDTVKTKMIIFVFIRQKYRRKKNHTRMK